VSDQASEDKSGLAKLLEPFPDKEISWKPKPTKAQTAEVKSDFKKGCRCQYCGGWHHPQAVHLAYVGHAATTKRLLDVDPLWDWEFLHVDDKGFPVFDPNGGLWITLTILGVTRKGYGDAEGKQGPNAVKEVIGDAIRNAAMRFGVALELWHKGEFEKHPNNDADSDQPEDGLYSSDEFDKNFPKWKEIISEGKKTSDQMLAFLAKKGIKLADDQKLIINSVRLNS